MKCSVPASLIGRPTSQTIYCRTRHVPIALFCFCSTTLQQKVESLVFFLRTMTTLKNPSFRNTHAVQRDRHVRKYARINEALAATTGKSRRQITRFTHRALHMTTQRCSDQQPLWLCSHNSRWMFIVDRNSTAGSFSWSERMRVNYVLENSTVEWHHRDLNSPVREGHTIQFWTDESQTLKIACSIAERIHFNFILNFLQIGIGLHRQWICMQASSAKFAFLVRSSATSVYLNWSVARYSLSCSLRSQQFSCYFKV